MEHVIPELIQKFSHIAEEKRHGKPKHKNEDDTKACL
jgi:hypothetical protein